MGKKTVFMIGVVFAAAVMTACGGDEEEMSSVSFADSYVAPDFSDLDLAGYAGARATSSGSDALPDDGGDGNTESGSARDGGEPESGADAESGEASDAGGESGASQAGTSRGGGDAESGTASDDGGESGSARDGDESESGAAQDGDAASNRKISGDSETDYRVRLLDYDSGLSGVSITYPQFSGWENTKKEDEWNETFYALAQNACQNVGPNDTVELDVEVMTQNGEVCSLVFSGSEYWEGAAHPYGYCYTYNIDMESGAKLTLADFADADEVADTLLNTDDYSINKQDLTLQDIFLYGYMGGETPSKSELSRDLALFDLSYEERADAGGTYQLCGSSFLKDGRLVLNMEVSHALGDYVWVTLDEV